MVTSGNEHLSLCVSLLYPQADSYYVFALLSLCCACLDVYGRKGDF